VISKGWISFFIFNLMVGTIGFFLVFPPMVKAIEVDPELVEEFKANDIAGYIIYFSAQANLTGAPKTDWKEQSEFINRALQENANRSQARVRSYLFGRRVPYRSFWKDNTIVVERSDQGIFEGLQFFKEIEAIQIYKTEPKAIPKTGPVEKKESGTDAKP
jgi:hypothetical protein